MRHVAEGELHAWLDGALDHIGEARAVQVREHLRSCAACREALVIEEALRARAAEVLALAAPPIVETPPFETLVERARVVPSEGTGTRSRITRMARVGWASSVVIALGAGWIARELGLHPGVGREEVSTNGATPSLSQSDEPSVAAPPEATPEVAARPSSPERADMMEPARRVTASAAPPVESQGLPPAVAATEALTGAVAKSSSVMAEEFEDVRTAPVTGAVLIEPLRDVLRDLPEVASAGPPRPLVAERPGPQDAVVGAGVRVAREPRSEALRQDRAASPAASAIGIARARPDSAGIPDLFARSRVGVVGRTSGAAVSTEADPEEGLDLIVADLPVLRVEWTQVTPGQAGLRVLQRLASGDTLEIRFVRSGGAAADKVADPLPVVVDAPLRTGWSQVVRVHRDGWLVARARLEREELEALVDRVGSGPR